MLDEVFPFLINLISRVLNFVFELEINKNPSITLGNFLIACAFIGLIIYFILGTDFIPNLANRIHIKTNGGSVSYKNKVDKPEYVPRHSPENVGKDFSTRVSRRKY